MKKILKILGKVLFYILFVVYMYNVFKYTLMDRMVSVEIKYELSLFWSYRRMLYLGGKNFFWYQIVLNICLLVPFGFFMPLIITKFKKRFLTYGVALALSATIEITQLLLHIGLFEFDDMINNTIGAIIGFGVYKFFTIDKQDSHVVIKRIAELTPLVVSTAFLYWSSIR